MTRLFAITSVLLCAAFLAACCGGDKKTSAVNSKPETLSQAVAKADKKCKADSDCVAVHKGCCMCAGYEAVNAKSAEKINKIWQKECALAPCTMQMCYVEITPSCKDNVCIGEPKPYEAYFSK